MKNTIILAASILWIVACQSSVYPVKTPSVVNELKNESGQNILVGHAPIGVLQKPDYRSWYDKAYQNYVVDSAALPYLKKELKNTTVDIFLGSWCGDSKREVPHMLKIFDYLGYDTGNVSLIFVDNSTKRYKQSSGHEEVGKNIHHVPTFIIYKEKKEIGRIIESPIVSLEVDLQQILVQQAYSPKYKAIQFWETSVSGKRKRKSDGALQNLVALIKPLCKHYGELNAYGYVLLAANKTNEALNIFRLNCLIYPETADEFDSLGEAWVTVGNKKAAMAAYQKVLALNPGNENAKKMLDKLK
jgi:tetratricopeptide (TPR) repeat protein